MLDSLIGGKDVLSAAPVFIQYNRLKDYLRKFRNIQASGGFPQVKADKNLIKRRFFGSTENHQIDIGANRRSLNQ